MLVVLRVRHGRKESFLVVGVEDDLELFVDLFSLLLYELLWLNFWLGTRLVLGCLVLRLWKLIK